MVWKGQEWTRPLRSLALGGPAPSGEPSAKLQDRLVLTAANSSNIQGVRQGTSLLRPPACSLSAPAILTGHHGISQEQQRAMTLQGELQQSVILTWPGSLIYRSRPCHNQVTRTRAHTERPVTPLPG